MSSGRFGGFSSEESRAGTYGGFSGGVYGDGGGFGGQSSDFQDRGESGGDFSAGGRQDRFEEYDEYDEGGGASGERRQPAAASSSRRKPAESAAKKPAPPKEPEVDLFSFDDPSPVSTRPAAPLASTAPEDDDFDGLPVSRAASVGGSANCFPYHCSHRNHNLAHSVCFTPTCLGPPSRQPVGPRWLQFHLARPEQQQRYPSQLLRLPAASHGPATKARPYILPSFATQLLHLRTGPHAAVPIVLHPRDQASSSETQRRRRRRLRQPLVVCQRWHQEDRHPVLGPGAGPAGQGESQRRHLGHRVVHELHPVVAAAAATCAGPAEARWRAG